MPSTLSSVTALIFACSSANVFVSIRLVRIAVFSDELKCTTPTWSPDGARLNCDEMFRIVYQSWKGM